MSTFDHRSDAPNMLRYESLNITLKVERTSNSTARISWNIPTPAAGCTAETQAYCGIVVTADNTAPDISKLPINGEVYTSDPTIDRNLFAGDKLGTALVVGAFYQDRTTTFFDITGLTPNTPLYVSGFPVDCEFRYFQEGVHGFSLDFKGPKTDATSSTQAVLLVKNDGTQGVLPTDYTGLVNNVEYTFSASLGLGSLASQPHIPLPPSACISKPTTFEVKIQGEDALTYADLVNAINEQFGLLTGCPASPLPPNAGVYYWNAVAQKLYQWDGYTLNELPVYVQPTAPNLIAVGTYWYKSSIDILYRWDGVAWIVQTVIKFSTDPTQPICDKTIWYDGTSIHKWNGLAWCDVITYVNTLDPSLQYPAPCGSYWYKASTKQMYKWDDNLDIWLLTNVIKSTVDPSALPVGFYWFNTTTMTLYQWNGITWVAQVNVRIQETTPTLPGPGTYWYNPITEVLQQWDGVMWVLLPDVITFGSDPRNRVSCDLWWNTITDELFVWNNVSNTWVLVNDFFQQETDPTIPPTITEGSYWLNPITLVIYVWINGCWVQTEYIFLPVDPSTLMPTGTVWFDGTNWYYWDGAMWVPFIPTISEIDPSLIAAGTYWFNTMNNTLNLWNGATWVNLMYVTVPPTPLKGDCWFNQGDNQVMTWDGTQWVVSPGIAMVELDCNGNLLFTDTNMGSSSFISVDGRVLTNSLEFGYPVWVPGPNGPGTLWMSLDVQTSFGNPQPGGDEISGEPMYKQLGVGTDGSADERRELMSEIRFQLGYPTIDVELMQEQLDYFIQKALDELRARTGIAYRRGYFFMQIQPETQRYTLSNKATGYNKIVQVMGVYRMTSAFLSSAHGAGVYGQIVLQHLYNMGTFDLLSYHLIAEYVELMEILFAARITFTWNEQTRELFLHHRFPFAERMVLIEASVERTEQDLLSDRWTKPWIRRYALAQSRIALAEIRGKFSTLPGASGGVSLNASDLRSAGVEEIALCLKDLEDYIHDNPEEYGSGSTMILG